MKSYRSGLSRFLSFCRCANLTPFPLEENTVCRFIAFLVKEQLTLGTVRLYLSAIRFHQISSGGRDPALSDMARLHYVLRGISRSGRDSTRPLRFPITINILSKLFHRWQSLPDRYEAILLWAAASLGFFGFLRAGEFTSVRGSDYVPLTLADIQVDSRADPSYLTVTLRASKTDPFGAGQTLYLGRTDSKICPVVGMLAYIAIRPAVAGPLLVHRDGSPLTRIDLVKAVRTALVSEGVNLTRFTGHSFRIGAATSAAQAGLPESLIQTLGRWRSSAYRRYIRTPTATLLDVPRTLIQTVD